MIRCLPNGQGEPYLRTAHGIMICYWDGIIHYGLYLAMIAAIGQRKSYRNLGLFWLGSLMMSIVVFLLGNLIGKYSSDLSPAFLLNLPYVLIPIWAGVRLFQQPKALPRFSPEKVSWEPEPGRGLCGELHREPSALSPSRGWTTGCGAENTAFSLSQVAEEQRKRLYQRPQDVGLILVLLLTAAFTFFRGMVVLDCPADSCFEYIYQHEPYLRDPVAYPKVQMLIYMFYVLPFFCLCIYGLVLPGCSWLPDWSLVFAGAVAQERASGEPGLSLGGRIRARSCMWSSSHRRRLIIALASVDLNGAGDWFDRNRLERARRSIDRTRWAQFSHLGSSLHARTPFPYQTPEDVWWSFLLTNVLYALGPQLLAYRCLRCPAFFLPATPASLHGGKKHQ
ncbi:hypothetical protein QYF61_016171 [Mycteria americana]|uniref:EXPERA domain-containing protein n=1 Tax=Mycteria americana TaxID=33587 RepID=A0AAN7N466_MYCAM|nr:hypothetical protein QYF61_016171 [Mycteria americana]